MPRIGSKLGCRIRLLACAAGIPVAPFTTRDGAAFKMYGMPSGIPAYIYEGIIEPDIQSGALLAVAA